MKLVSIYKRKNEYNIHSNSQTKSGIWIASEPFYNISINSDITRIVECILICGNACKYKIKDILDWESNTKYFMSSMKIKSLTSFYKNVRHCNIIFSENSIEITPYTNKGTKHGLLPISEYTRTFEEPLTLEIVKELLDMLENVAK